MHIPIFILALGLVAGASAAADITIEKGRVNDVTVSPGNILVHFSSDSDGVTCLEHKDRIIVARWNKYSDGCMVECYDAAAAKRFTVALTALGPPVAHSQYYNDVKMYCINAKIYIIGTETAGTYCEIRDAADGKLISSDIEK